jgi:hypothetical protein
MGIANGERSAQKQAGENRPHVVPAPIGHLQRYSVKAGRVATSRHFAAGQAGDTNRKGTALFPARSCDLSKRGCIAKICGARREKSDIDWF